MTHIDPPPSRALRIQRSIVRAVPLGFLQWLGRKAPTNRAGDRLAPEIAGILKILGLIPGPDLIERPLNDARRELEDEAVVFSRRSEPFAVVEDLQIPGPSGTIMARRFRARSAHPRGAIVYFHGGGWVLGSRRSHEPIARFLALHTGADVISVDYRLAPENPFPAAIEDALAAYEFVVEHAAGWDISPDRIVVAGDSAGGNISAVISRLLRKHPHRPALQVLFVPVTDLSRERASYEEFAGGLFLTRAHMRWYKEHYLSDPADALDPRASPLLAPDDEIVDLPPAWIGVGGFDPLRDEGLAYAERLSAAGNDVTVYRAADLFHAYVNVTGFSPSARTAVRHAADAIVTTLRR